MYRLIQAQIRGIFDNSWSFNVLRVSKYSSSKLPIALTHSEGGKTRRD